MGIDPRRIRRGMQVRNTDGQRIGRVVGVEDGWIHVRRGRILPDDYYASPEDVEAIDERGIVLEMRATLPGEHAHGRHSGSRGGDVAARTGDTRLQ